MAKNRFKTPYPEKPSLGSFEAFIKPSMTEPDNTMSIPEIIARYTRGQGIVVNQNPWVAGVAPEDGVEQHDATMEQVLGLEVKAPAQPQPAQPAEATQLAAPAAAPSASAPAEQPE